MDIGKLIREHRQSYGLTLQEVSNKASLHFNVVWKAEQGIGSIGTINAICLAIGIELVGLPKSTSLGRSLQLQRTKAGLSISGLARLSGVSSATIRRSEADGGHIKSLDRILGVLTPDVRPKRPKPVQHRHSAVVDVRLTPPNFVGQVRYVLGNIDLDPSAHPDSHVNATRSYFGNADDDGLLLQWSGKVFCNPPYSNLDRWIRKGHSEWKSGNAEVVMMLVPVRTNQSAFQLANDGLLLLLAGRMHFWASKTERMLHRSPSPSAVIMFGGNALMIERAIETWEGLVMRAGVQAV